MVVSKKNINNTNVKINNEQIKRFEKNLGTYLNEKKDYTKKITKIIVKVRSAFVNMKWVLNLKLKIRSVKWYIYSVVLHGEQT